MSEDRVKKLKHALDLTDHAHELTAQQVADLTKQRDALAKAARAVFASDEGRGPRDEAMNELAAALSLCPPA